MSASQRKTLSFYEQLELIDDVKVKKLKLAAAAKKYGIGYSTAAKILKKEDDLRSCMQMNGNINRKRKRQSVHKDVNEALTQWFTQACAHGAIINDHVIRQKASQLAVNLEVDFEPSNGWLMRWKQANNVSFKKFHGRSTSADHENDKVSPPSGMEQTDFDKFISFDDRTQCYGELTETDITRGIKSDDQDFDEDDDAEVSESDKPVPNSLAALNALETLTAYFEAKSSNPDGALKMIYGLYESFYDVNKEISVQSKMTNFFKKK